MAFLERNANRGSISLEYDVDNSLKVEGDNNEYLSRSTSGATDGSSTQHTISVWVKRTELGIDSEPVSAGGIGRFRFESDDTFSYQFRSGREIITTRKFRDCSAWYHIVAVGDSTQATASNRMKLYVNGVQETSFGTAVYQDQNQAAPGWGKNTLYSLRVGAASSSTRNFHGYIAEMYYIDGQVLDPTYFGRFDSNGVWVPKAFSGSHGSLDTYLDFSDSSNLGKNSVSGGTDLTATNISAIDQATDTPTNNFCTMNQNARTNGNIRTQEGGTFVTTDGGSGWCSMLGTMAMSAGKWYWEALVWDNSDALTVYVGIAPHNDPYIPHSQGGYYLGNVETAGSMGWYLSDGSNKNQNGSWGNPDRGDKLMFAYDADNYKMYYGINGTWGNSADPANGTGSVTAISSYWMSALKDPLDFVLPAVTVYQGKGMKGFNFGGVNTWTIDSGNADANGYGNFEYAPPTGFYALCSKNLAQYGG